MTTHPDHHEPLDAEERDLAARLGRVGPFDGPSPTLDAKILAAAHAAAATRVSNRRRHFAWLGVPPALVTGVGVAAAAVLALGLVWQMRPQYAGIAARGEADAEEEVILIAPPGSAEAPVANPQPLPTSPAAPAERASAAARAENSAPAPASAKAMASAPAAEPAVADEAGGLAAQAVAPSEDAPTEEKRPTDSSASTIDGFVAEPPGTAAPVRNNHATYTTAARATAERRERASRNAKEAAATAPAPAAAAPVAAVAESDATTLDRIEVTGSRIRNAAEAWSEIPVSDDSRLAVAEWLQRIRARRDDGDLEHARASLLLFQRQHPRVRLPADLRPLLIDRKQ